MNSSKENKSILDIGEEGLLVKSKILTWSNIISATRLFVSFPIVTLHYYNNQQVTPLIIGLIIYGILSDYLDGYVARKTDNVSVLGSILDPLADKLTAFVLFLYTVIIDLIPVWFFIIAVIRDLLILGGSNYIRHTTGKVAMAVTSGKVSVNALALYWIIAFLLPDAVALQHFFMGTSLALMVYSFFDYLHRFNEIRKVKEFA